jgi:hypothetical protein
VVDGLEVEGWQLLFGLGQIDQRLVKEGLHVYLAFDARVVLGGLKHYEQVGKVVGLFLGQEKLGAVLGMEGE